MISQKDVLLAYENFLRACENAGRAWEKAEESGLKRDREKAEDAEYFCDIEQKAYFLVKAQFKFQKAA